MWEMSVFVQACNCGYMHTCICVRLCGIIVYITILLCIYMHESEIMRIYACLCEIACVQNCVCMRLCVCVSLDWEPVPTENNWPGLALLSLELWGLCAFCSGLESCIISLM